MTHEDGLTQAKAQFLAAQLALLDKLASLGLQVGDVRKELLDMVAATFDLARVGTNAEGDIFDGMEDMLPEAVDILAQNAAQPPVDERTAHYLDYLRSYRG